jgi:putative ABC transport system permease protein
MLHDLRFAIRALLKRPSFAAGTIFVLALAVGVNTAVFSLVNALLLRPLPVPAADRLAFAYHSEERRSIGFAAYRELREKVDVFDGMAARSGDSARLRSGADVVLLQGEAVTAGYFEVLGVAPRIGRSFEPRDDSAGASPVAIIGEGLWKAQFAADPEIVGRTLRIDAVTQISGRYAAWRDYTIVGVMAGSFAGTGNPWQPAQYWVPIEQRAVDLRAARGERERLDDRPVVPIGRLKPGVTFAQARAAVDAAGRAILQHSDGRVGRDATFRLLTARRVRLPFQGAYFIDVPRVLATLGAVATLLLVIAGANLAGMLLARGVSRPAEIAIRLSLGVPRARLVRQLLVEAAVMAVAAGGAGLLLARLLVAAALRGLPSQIPGSNAVAIAIDVPVDPRVIAFAFGSGLLTALVVGVAPAVQALRVDLLSTLQTAAPAATRSRSRLRQAVLVPQIALSVVLLLVTGVFVRELLRLELAPPGYRADQVVMLETQYPQKRPGQELTMAQRRDEGAQLGIAQRRMLDRLAGIPGVTSVALTEAFDAIPLPASSTSIISRADYETSRQYRGVMTAWVSGDYFVTLGIPLLRGRTFDARERVAGATAIVVTERLADELWPGRDPIGQQLALHSPDSSYPVRWLDVIGEVASVTRPLDESPRPALFLPVELQPLAGTAFLVRGAGNPAELASAAKAAIVSADPSVIVARARPLQATVSDIRYPRRFTAGLLGASGLAALVLAAIGVFALMSYSVAQRVGEIGIRMVLGAGRREIVSLIVKDGAAVTIAGIGLGFALAFAAIRYASHAIVPLPDADAMTFIAVPAVLALVVLLACYLPARRAARVDPLVVLRQS